MCLPVTPRRGSMERNPRASCHSADRVGASARRILAAAASGTILASHSRATYLLSASDELLWLAPEDVPMHRRGVRVAGLVPRAPASSTFRVADESLLLGSTAVIDLSQALAWEPERRSWPPRLLATAPQRPAGGASELLCGLPPPRGFGTFCPHSPSTPTEEHSRVGRGNEPRSWRMPRLPSLDRAGLPRAGRHRTPGTRGGIGGPGRGPDPVRR